MLIDQEPFPSIPGENVMIQPEPNPAMTEFEPSQSGRLASDENGHSRTGNADIDDPKDEVTLRGVVAIDISREVIARFSGTLILNELPERQPEIVFDRGQYSRGEDDE
jgi:hypothetical protein